MSPVADSSSFNFSVAKVVAILLVVAGHYFTDSPLWVPVTTGLLIFAYSSALFTTRKYADQRDSYWANKLERLVIPYWVAHAFLLALFLVQGRHDIVSWFSLIHWTGQSGWLNWLGIANHSPFGAGLWFFTLLLIFYLLFPLLARLNRDRSTALPALALATLAAMVLAVRHDVGHALWPTALAFWFGVYAGRHPLPGPARVWLVLFVLGALAFVAASQARIPALSIPALTFASLAAAVWLEKARLEPRFFRPLLIASPCLLEIYLIHGYLFLDFGANRGLQFALSLLLIILVARILAAISERIRRRIFARPACT